MRGKSIIKLLCTVLYTTILIGCSTGLSEDDLTFRDLSKESDLFGSKIILMASEDWVTDAEMELGTNFEAVTGIQVVYDLYPDEEYLDTLFNKLDSNNPPDIFMTQSGLAIKNTYKLDKYAADLSGESWVKFYDDFSEKETSIDGHN